MVVACLEAGLRPHSGILRNGERELRETRPGQGHRRDRMAKRTRIDVLMVERGLAPTREKAQALLMAGSVTVDGRPVSKPGTAVAAEAGVDVRAPLQYVGRGGDKMAGALDALGLDPAGAVVLDVGASTGGFTDCLLQRGAARVYDIDVGRGQLAHKLLIDPRVDYS